MKIKDINCGLKAFGNYIKSLDLKYDDARWFLDTEIIVRSIALGKKISQIEIKHHFREDSSSKLKILSTALETFKFSIILKLELIKSNF